MSKCYFSPSVLNTPVTLIHFSAPTQTDRKQQFQYKRFSVEMQLMEWKFCKLHKPTFLYHARGLHFPTSWFPIKHSCSKRNPEISTRGAAAVIRDLLIWKLCQCFPHTSSLQFFWICSLWKSCHVSTETLKPFSHASKADVLHLHLTFNLLFQSAKSTTKCCLCEENQPAIAARSCANLPLLARFDNQVFVSHVDEPEGDPGLSNKHVHDTCTAPAAKETFTP